MVHCSSKSHLSPKCPAAVAGLQLRSPSASYVLADGRMLRQKTALICVQMLPDVLAHCFPDGTPKSQVTADRAMKTVAPSLLSVVCAGDAPSATRPLSLNCASIEWYASAEYTHCALHEMASLASRPSGASCQLAAPSVLLLACAARLSVLPSALLAVALSSCCEFPLPPSFAIPSTPALLLDAWLSCGSSF